MIWWLPLIQAGISLFGAIKQSQDLGAQAKLVEEIGTANAGDVIELFEKNSKLRRKAAKYNAKQTWDLGFAGASAIMNSADHNYALMNASTNYKEGKMLLAQRYLLGDVRARVASSGISVNVGTPLYFQNQQAYEMTRDRKYTVAMEQLSALGALSDETQRAQLLLTETKQRADMTEFNSELEIEAMMNEALAQSNATKRGSMLNSSGLRVQASSALYSGLSDAIGFGVKAYGNRNV